MSDAEGNECQSTKRGCGSSSHTLATDPASCTRPDRPSPQSQSFSRSYGSGLPTSLTYIVLFVQRLFTLETSCGHWYGSTDESPI